MEERLTEVRRELEDPEVWAQLERSQALNRERSRLEDVVDSFTAIEQGLRESQELLAMAAEEDDDATVSEIAADLEGIERKLSTLEFRRMFSGEMDAKNAFVDIQAGSGGTEAQDWADMLLRMYLRWGERHGQIQRRSRLRLAAYRDRGPPPGEEVAL